MTVTLTRQSEEAIRRLVESGRFKDGSAVVDEALRALDERERFARLKAAIAVGDEQYARGQVTTWTPDFLDRLKEAADEADRRGDPIKDDVQS